MILSRAMCAAEQCTGAFHGILIHDRFWRGQIVSMRCVACLAASLSFFIFASVHAQNPIASEIRQLQAAISTINSELKADLDQMQMLEEAIRLNARSSLAVQGRSPDPESFDDLAAAQRRAIQRETAINARLDALLARSAVLDARKRPLIERIQELGMQVQEPSAKMENAQK